MSTSKNTKLIELELSKLPLPPAVKIDQNLMSDLAAIQSLTLDLHQASIEDQEKEFSKEFKELQEMLMVMSATAKLIGHNAHLYSGNASFRLKFNDGGLITVNISEKSDKPKLKVYIRRFDTEPPKMGAIDTYYHISQEEKVQVLQKILESL